MTYRLYNRPGSAGLCVEATLTLAGLPFELVELDSKAGSALPESFKRINPWCQVPTLVLTTGETMTETAAILAYLVTAHPENGIGPEAGSPAFGRFLRWIGFAAVNIQEGGLRMSYPERYTDDPQGEAGVIRGAKKRVEKAFEVLEQAIAPGPFLSGNKLGCADIYFTMLYGWRDPASETPSLESLNKRVRAPGELLTESHFSKFAKELIQSCFLPNYLQAFCSSLMR